MKENYELLEKTLAFIKYHFDPYGQIISCLITYLFKIIWNASQKPLWWLYKKLILLLASPVIISYYLFHVVLNLLITILFNLNVVLLTIVFMLVVKLYVNGTLKLNKQDEKLFVSILFLFIFFCVLTVYLSNKEKEKAIE